MITITPRPTVLPRGTAACRWIGFVFSNEQSSRFKYPTARRGGEYLGIGSHQNFDHICRTSPDKAILVDISDEVPRHLEGLMAAMKIPHNPLEFWSLLGNIMPVESAREVRIDSDLHLKTSIKELLFDPYSPMKEPPAQSPEAARKNEALARKELSPDEFNMFMEWTKERHDDMPMIQRLFQQTYCVDRKLFVEYACDQDNIWLKSLGAFSFIRSLIVSGNIIVIKGDISDDRVLDEIRGRTSNLTTCYMTNVRESIKLDTVPVPFGSLFRMLPWSGKPMLLDSHFPLDNSGPRYEVSYHV